MLVNLDKFELLNYINGCAIGSHLRQGIWQRCVDEFYDKLNDKERAFIYEISLRDFWEIMARAKSVHPCERIIPHYHSSLLSSLIPKSQRLPPLRNSHIEPPHN